MGILDVLSILLYDGRDAAGSGDVGDDAGGDGDELLVNYDGILAELWYNSGRFLAEF